MKTIEFNTLGITPDENCKDEEDKKKIFILDTNILIEDPSAITGFDDNLVVVTDVTLEELDGLKKAPGDTGYNARKAIRNIAAFKEGYMEGIELENGGKFSIAQYSGNAGYEYMDDKKADNRIIIVAKKIAAMRPAYHVILVTNDISMQVKASLLGLEVENYRNVRVKNTGFMGRRLLESAEAYEVIDRLYAGEEITKEEIEKVYEQEQPLEVNEYLILKSGSISALAKVSVDGTIKLIRDKKEYPCNVVPRNVGQKFALDALMASAEECPLVILKGPAGCAKTFLALAAGLDGVFDGKYNKVIISRNNVLSDIAIGFLRGSLEEKMDPLLAPFYDNLETILRGSHGADESTEQIRMEIEDLKESGILEIASLAYVRGRSITRSFIIVDEVQNATPNQILTIVTRAAQGSKVVLCGDPDQIDASYLDKENNGLVFASEKMKGSHLCAQVTFGDTETVRSELATEAAVRMTK